MNKFKVGDHVKGNEKSEYSVTDENMIDAKVVSVIDEDIIEIMALRFLDGDTHCIGFKTAVNSKYFDYADGYESKCPKSKENIFTINGHLYTNEQYIKDVARFVEEFPEDKTIELSHAIEDILIVYQWVQDNPVITNIDHYAKELGWEDKQKERVLKYGVPLPNYFKEPSKSVTDDWWDAEYHAPENKE